MSVLHVNCQTVCELIKLLNMYYKTKTFHLLLTFIDILITPQNTNMQLLYDLLLYKFISVVVKLRDTACHCKPCVFHDLQAKMRTLQRWNTVERESDAFLNVLHRSCLLVFSLNLSSNTQEQRTHEGTQMSS